MREIAIALHDSSIHKQFCLYNSLSRFSQLFSYISKGLATIQLRCNFTLVHKLRSYFKGFVEQPVRYIILTRVLSVVTKIILTFETESSQ